VLSYSDRLREQASALQRRAFELIREADALKAEAVELRTDADRLDREPVRVAVGAGTRVLPRLVPNDEPAGDHDVEYMGRVRDLLATAGGMTVRQVAEHTHTSATRARAALGRMEALGVVTKFGRTAGTRYTLVEDEPKRTGVATLHVFTKTMNRRELVDREVAWSTEAPAVVGALPARDDG
jgi:ABC-type phosphonate transport system ATPase subunit